MIYIYISIYLKLKNTNMNSLTITNLDNIINIHSNMLSVKELLNIVNYNYNELYIDKFWDNIENDKWVYIDSEMLKYIGYSEVDINASKRCYLNILKDNFDELIDYKLLNNKEFIQNTKCQLWHLENKELNSHNKTKHLIVSPDCFKQTLMLLRTDKSKEIRKYYIELEKIFKFYLQYQAKYQELKNLETIKELENKVKELENKYKEAQSNKFEDEREHVISTFNTYESYVDENLSYYKKIVLDILDIKRAEDQNLRRDTIFAIANINPSIRPAFKPIAELFSMRCENKWNRQEFEKIWNEASNCTSENNLTLKSIIQWAYIDNKEKFKKLTDKDIINTIKLDVYNSDNRILDGTLYQFQFARYLYQYHKHKFVYDIDIDGKGKWYEFVLDNDSHDVGEIYKWREEIKPDSLSMYLSNKLPQTINKVILKAEDLIRNNPDNEKENEYVAFRTKNLKNSAKDLYKSAFKDGIIKEAKIFFRIREFLKN